MTTSSEKNSIETITVVPTSIIISTLDSSQHQSQEKMRFQDLEQMTTMKRKATRIRIHGRIMMGCVLVITMMVYMVQIQSVDGATSGFPGTLSPATSSSSSTSLSSRKKKQQSSKQQQQQSNKSNPTSSSQNPNRSNSNRNNSSMDESSYLSPSMEEDGSSSSEYDDLDTDFISNSSSSSTPPLSSSSSTSSSISRTTSSSSQSSSSSSSSSSDPYQPLRTLKKLQAMLDETDYATSAGNNNMMDHIDPPESSSVPSSSSPESSQSSQYNQIPNHSNLPILIEEEEEEDEENEDRDLDPDNAPNNHNGVNIVSIDEDNEASTEDEDAMDDSFLSEEESEPPERLWTSKDRSKYRKQQRQYKRKRQQQQQQNQQQYPHPHPHPQQNQQQYPHQQQGQAQTQQYQQQQQQMQAQQAGSSDDDATTDDTDGDGLGYTLPNLPIFFSDGEETESDGGSTMGSMNYLSPQSPNYSNKNANQYNNPQSSQSSQPLPQNSQHRPNNMSPYPYPLPPGYNYNYPPHPGSYYNPNPYATAPPYWYPPPPQHQSQQHTSQTSSSSQQQQQPQQQPMPPHAYHPAYYQHMQRPIARPMVTPYESRSSMPPYANAHSPPSTPTASKTSSTSSSTQNSMETGQMPPMYPTDPFTGAMILPTHLPQQLPPPDVTYSSSASDSKAISLAEAGTMITFDSLQKGTFILLSVMLLAYCAVSPRTLPVVEYNKRFKENLGTTALVLIAPILTSIAVFDAKENDINTFISTFYTAFTVGYLLCFLLEIFATTILRLLVFSVWEPAIFQLTPTVPSIILPWVLRENKYRPKRITLFAADFVTSCLASPIIEEYMKFKLVQWSVRLPRNFQWTKSKSINKKDKKGNKKKQKKPRREMVPRLPGEDEVTNINSYVTHMLAASLGLKLCDSVRRIMMYTKRKDSNKQFYAVLRGIFPVHELCGAMTALEWAKRDVLGVDLPMWRILAPAVIIHGMANFRGMKPIFKLNSSTPWSEMQLNPWNMEDNSTFKQLMSQGLSKLIWFSILFRVLGYCIKNYYMISRKAVKRATTFAGKQAAFSAELAAADMLKKTKKEKTK